MSSSPKTYFMVLYTLIFIITKSGIVLYVQMPAFWQQRQEDQKYKIVPDYMASYRPAKG